MAHTTGFQDFLVSDGATHDGDIQENDSNGVMPASLQPLFEQYCRDGYLVHNFEIDPDLIDACAQHTMALKGRYSRVQDMWRRSDEVRQLAAHPAVLEFISTLYNRKAFPFQTLNFPVGTQQAAHSDAYHFNSFPERYMCGVWIALEDVDMANGPLRYYPGSHELPILTRAEIALSHPQGVSAYFEEKAKNYSTAHGTIKKGEAIIWSANLLHGGEAIKDPGRTRLSQVTHYYFDDCVYLTPAISDPEIGKTYIREPYDFSRNRFVQSRLNGKPVPGHWRYRLSGRLWNMRKFCPSIRS